MAYRPEFDPERIAWTKKYLNREEKWPMGDILPMRDYSKDLFQDDDTLGVVVWHDPLKVFVGNLIMEQSWASVKILTFRSIEEMIDAGWLVD